MGRKWGIPVFVLDALKGIIPALVGTFVVGEDKVAYTLVAASVLGHMFPVTRRLRGGKGVATMAGAMFVMQPLIRAILGVVWITVLKISKKSSVASIALIIGLPIWPCCSTCRVGDHHHRSPSTRCCCSATPATSSACCGAPSWAPAFEPADD